jgi:16S rRNA (uracil1498-N3)-methyltransferase
VEKFQRAVIEASKQCGRNRLMSVDGPRTWAAFLALPGLPTNRFVLHTAEGEVGFPEPGECVLAVGPEGGFTPEEVTAAQAAGWRSVSLGPRVLRVETAAIAAACAIMSKV